MMNMLVVENIIPIRKKGKEHHLTFILFFFFKKKKHSGPNRIWKEKKQTN